MSNFVMTYGRFNPPTIGHQRLVDTMKRISRQLEADSRIYLSSTTGKNNPLDFEYKHMLVEKAFRDLDVSVSTTQYKDIFAAVSGVSELGYPNLHVIVGGDRFEELSYRLPKYNGSLYKFNWLTVTSAGDRDDSSGIKGMSASKLREAAKLGDYASFESGLPIKLRSMSSDIYDRVRQACQSEALETI